MPLTTWWGTCGGQKEISCTVLSFGAGRSRHGDILHLQTRGGERVFSFVGFLLLLLLPVPDPTADTSSGLGREEGLVASTNPAGFLAQVKSAIILVLAWCLPYPFISPSALLQIWRSAPSFACLHWNSINVSLLNWKRMIIAEGSGFETDVLSSFPAKWV